MKITYEIEAKDIEMLNAVRNYPCDSCYSQEPSMDWGCHCEHASTCAEYYTYTQAWVQVKAHGLDGLAKTLIAIDNYIIKKAELDQQIQQEIATLGCKIGAEQAKMIINAVYGEIVQERCLGEEFIFLPSINKMSKDLFN